MPTPAPPEARRPPRPSSPPDRWRPSHPWQRRILWANLVGQVGIVVSGGVVRLSGSGLGCSTWPQCEPGRFTPTFQEATSWHPYIEFGNRTLTGVLVLLALATAWVVWPLPRALPFRMLGLVPLLGVGVQAVVGGMTVLWDLHPGFVATHFLLSMLLVGASTVLLVRHREGDRPPVAVVGSPVRVLVWASLPLAAVVQLLGVVTTGAGPHSGDAEVGYRFAVDPVTVARVHAGSVWLYLVVVVAVVLAVFRRAGPPKVRRAAVVLLVVTLTQGLVGYVQYFTGLPEVLVVLHLLGASLLVIAQVLLLLSVRSRAGSVG